MDYNYVRMRDALKRGDLHKAEEYKILYETGRVQKKHLSLTDYVIAILLCITVLLGIYILHSEAQYGVNNSVTEKTQAGEVGE